MGRRRANPPKVDPEERILELMEEGDEAAYAVAYDQAIDAGLTEYIVLFELAKVLDVDPSDLEIEDDDWYGNDTLKASLHRRASSHRGGLGYAGHSDYRVVASDDVAEAIAIADVTQQLESEPENFNQDWLQGHVDQGKLKKTVREMVMEDSYVDDIARDEPELFWELAQRHHVSVPDEDDDGEMPEPEEEHIDAVKEKLARQAERDPTGYLSDFVEDLPAWLIEHVGIDVKAAAADAVSTDGWQHFLCGYDGNSYSLPSGHVYWRQD